MAPEKKKKKEIMSRKRIGSKEPLDPVEVKKLRVRRTKKVLYIEIDDEVTTIYDRLKKMKIKNLYLVVPKRAILFQSIVNLKILKRKAEDLSKNIYIVTNDQNGIHLASKIGLPVYDKLEGHEHPSLVSGKFMEDQQTITPLKASINALDDEAPTRRKEKKFSISELIRRQKRSGLVNIAKNLTRSQSRKGKKEKKNADERGKLVLVAPNRHALVSLVVVTLLILVTITYVALPGATIALTPKSNVIESLVNVTLADIELNRAELDTRPKNMIPSYTITKKIHKVLTYQATGKEFQGKNASGTITLKNVSNNDWPLVVKTRFQTDDGMVFRLQGAVNVPSGSPENPGTLNVTVVADPFDAYGQPIGSRGNIGPMRFFLPGLSSSNQKKLYGENTQSFTGGETIVSKQISAEDIDAARNKMSNDLRASAEVELQANVKERNDRQKSNLVLLKSSETIEMSEPKVIIASGLEGQKIESFEVQGEIVTSGVAYSKDDLLGILKINFKRNPEKRLYRIDEESFSYNVVDVDKSSRKVKITSTLKGIEEYEIRPSEENGQRLIRKIKEHVLTMPIDEAEIYIQNLSEIDKVHIESWPAWAPNMPGIPDNISIEVRRSY